MAHRDGGIELDLPVAHDLASGLQRLQGVLTAERGFSTPGGVVHAVALDLPVAGTPVPGPQPAQAEATTGLASFAAPASTSLSRLPAACC